MAPSEFAFAIGSLVPTEAEFREVLGLMTDDEAVPNEKKKAKKIVFKGFKFKIANASIRRLLSGAIAGAVSRTAVAPLETIRTHLMVGSGGKITSVAGMFHQIMERDGWQGLFRGNGVNVLRVAPSKAIELFAYDTVKTYLTPKNGEPSSLPVPPSTIAGATAGVCSTLTMYPLELLKTRLTVEVQNLQQFFIERYPLVPLINPPIRVFVCSMECTTTCYTPLSRFARKKVQ
jgi:hypothetical protein